MTSRHEFMAVVLVGLGILTGRKYLGMLQCSGENPGAKMGQVHRTALAR